MSSARSDATATGKAPVRRAETKVSNIPLQQASVDIWDKKYRLKSKSGEVVDKDVDHTYQRVARALAAVEQSPEKKQHWYERFLWAFRHGAIPAGRIISNAGAMHHKPATSTINCTVSGLVKDSMDDILDKVHEAGLTLKAGCGIGYEFSTLRPKGAYVSGAGAYTSGPLSFMDIYDKMCFTVSSAGGRRGAQMATFDVGHPDVKDFIRAKREDGRLRQFNMSLLITEDFIDAVKANSDWKLAFPISEKEVEDDGIDIDDKEGVIWRDWPYKKGYVTNTDGLIACKVYGSVKARRLWDMIMASTYDYAEPGFILIDKVNEMNNNWFCENVRATNPCVTADTWVHTESGPRQVHQLLGRAFRARVEGIDYDSGSKGFFLTATKPVVRIETSEGYELRLTTDHRVRRVTVFDRFNNDTEWCKAEDLRAGDRVLLNNHRDNVEWPGSYNHAQGYLLGLLVGGGSLGGETAELSAWKQRIAVNDVPAKTGADGVMSEALISAMTLSQQDRVAGWQEIVGHNEYRLSLTTLKELALQVGMAPGNVKITPAIESGSSKFYRGFLRGLFDADASIQESEQKGVRIKLAQNNFDCLRATQRMLLRLGVVSKVCRNDQSEGNHSQHKRQGSASIKQQHELVIAGDNVVQFEQLVGFADTAKGQQLRMAVDRYYQSLNRERFTARVKAVEGDDVADVYDVQVPGINTFDANGLHAHNCGEQPLPEYGACLLGSVNLTRFVREPFTDNAHFDWKEFREVVAVFTRMLDNVVEINGLPLGKQRQEIERKRRHGMGYLGLGSTLTMLRMRYGSPESLEFTERVSQEVAITGWQQALDLAEEKGPAPLMNESFVVTEEMLRKRPEMKRDGYRVGDRVKGKILHAKYSRYMQQVAQVDPKLVDRLAEVGARFTHHSSIAPTGTISLSLANNASNGIEPSFAHMYSRNVIREGKKTKEKVDVFSYELLAYRQRVTPDAQPQSEDRDRQLPDYFITAEDISPRQHVDIQAAAQKWVDSSISKTANVPTEFPFEQFKDIYMYAYEKGLKGCTTFRFNPEAFQGVLVKEKDLAATVYEFALDDGSTVTARGNEEIEYDGEVHTAANLFDALKEGYYGKF